MSSLENIIVDTVKPLIVEQIKAEKKDLLGSIRTIKVMASPRKAVKQITTEVHNKFEDVLRLINSNIPVMLTGGAGSGKTGTCEKVAEVLGLEFYFSNAVTQEYKLTGFIDANGNYQETQFYKAFKNGGLFVLDEIDASVPEALVILNTALANGYFDFPNGKIQAHPDFRVVACANTYGLGSDDLYVGRCQLDAATLDRFAVVEFDYDENLEKSLVVSTEWAEFIQSLRARIREKRVRHILSMRATIYGDKLLQLGTPINTILQEVVFKNLKIDDIKTLGKLDNANNDYVHAYNTYIIKGGN